MSRPGRAGAAVQMGALTAARLAAAIVTVMTVMTVMMATMVSSAQAQTAAADTRRSGRLDMSPATRAMQDVDAQNPGMLWLQTGQALWEQAAGTRQRSCGDCHGPPSTLAAAAARYPRMSPDGSRPLSLAQRVNLCRVEQQHAPALAAESNELLSLETLLAHAARGQPITPDADPRLAAWTERGRARFQQRLGQLDLSCAQCHEQLAGGRLGGSLIPQAHPTGYPQYRLEWQGLGSLQRRLRNCLTGVRAEPWAADDVAWTELELYLKQRAAGMPIETPAVRP